MRTAFDQNYFDKAYGGEYEKRNPARKLRYYLAEILRIKTSGSLLDVGCAYGSFLSHARQYYNVTGIDISREAIDRARTRLPGEDIVRSDIAAFRRDSRFDVITCFDVLEHVADLDAVFETLKGHLREKGILVVTVPVYDTLVGKAVRLLDRDETHVWKESREFWRAKLAEHGFALLTDHGLWRYSLFGWYYLFWGGRTWRSFSPAILLIGERK
jgi:SAM-dependent methyltransferase